MFIHKITITITLINNSIFYLYQYFQCKLSKVTNKKATFINISNKVFAEYVLIYRVNDGYSVSDLKNFKSKHQLFFQRIESINQQLNLIFVDSVFTNILADVVLEVFINKIKSFNECIITWRNQPVYRLKPARTINMGNCRNDVLLLFSDWNYFFHERHRLIQFKLVRYMFFEYGWGEWAEAFPAFDL